MVLRVIDGKNWGEQDFSEKLKLAGKGRELPKTRFLIFFAKKHKFFLDWSNMKVLSHNILFC